MARQIDENTYKELLDARNKICAYCEVDECENCIMARLIDDAYAEAVESGIIEE